MKRSLVLVALALAASPAFAATLSVTNTADSGAGSLRQAMLDSNASLGVLDTIAFNIPGTGVHTIAPLSALPTILDPVIIDGYTQPGSSPNTNATGGLNTVLKIELNGTSAGISNGLTTMAVGGNTIRGLAINRFSIQGIALSSTANNVIEGNFIGTNVTGTAASPNAQSGIYSHGSNNVFGGLTPSARNLLSGNTARGIDINPGDGGTASDNLVQGNLIGTDLTGTTALGNALLGVNIAPGASGNIIGGTVAGVGNIISGNGGVGIELDGANNFVQGNFIGTDSTGTANLGNSSQGVRVDSVAGNIIGGIVAGAGNLISGNDEGMEIRGVGADDTIVQGNFLGTDASGTTALGNVSNGIRITNGPIGTAVGGLLPGAGNIISGNLEVGLVFELGTSANLVEGNFIGTDVTGSTSLGNGGAGIVIEDAPDNTIGGTTTGASNLISGNLDDGIFIAGASATNNLIQGNHIGTQANGVDALGNAGDGIDFSSSNPAFNNVVGSTLSSEGNLIAFNTDRGIFVSGGTGNAIVGNSIFSNGGLGIDIGEIGVTPNDDGDADTGPNNLQNFPVLTSAILAGGQSTIMGSLNSKPNTTFRIEFFGNAFVDPSGNGEGQTFLGSQDVTTDGSGDVAFTAVLPGLPPIGQFIAQTIISATATDPADNTSEFSSTVEAPITAGQLLNISTRMRVLTGDNVLIGGFIILGPDPKQVIVRAIGPSLGPVLGTLADPTLELHLPDGSIITNDNWRDTQETEIEATGLPPSDDLESAIVATLEPGAYTALVRGVDGGTGVGLVEAYDLDPAAGSAANISTRGFIDTGDNAMIGGFIIGAGGGGSATVMVRGIGPSLTAQGVPGALEDPTLALHDVNGLLLESNDDWKETQQAEIEATGLAPAEDRESAILSTLPPGAYTAIVRGVGDTTGVGLVEAYNLQ